MRLLLATALLALALAAPAEAAGVGVSLPKFRALTLSDAGGSASSLGGSVQVLGTNLGAGALQLDIGLDYGYTRDFAHATNYGFFDFNLGAGLPLRLGPQVYLTPALDGHALGWVASPQGLDSPSWGLAPRLTVGFNATSQVKVELSVSQLFLLGLRGGAKAYSGGMTIAELGGSYSF